MLSKEGTEIIPAGQLVLPLDLIFIVWFTETEGILKIDIFRISIWRMEVNLTKVKEKEKKVIDWAHQNIHSKDKQKEKIYFVWC